MLAQDGQNRKLQKGLAGVASRFSPARTLKRLKRVALAGFRAIVACSILFGPGRLAVPGSVGQSQAIAAQRTVNRETAAAVETLLEEESPYSVVKVVAFGGAVSVGVTVAFQAESWPQRPVPRLHHIP